jgi:hypothetical protein
MVEGVVLMDPVCLCTCLPKLAVASNVAPRWRDFPSLNFWTAVALVLARTDFTTGQASREPLPEGGMDCPAVLCCCC